MTERDTSQSNELKTLLDCLRCNKEDEALDLIASMNAGTLSLYQDDGVPVGLFEARCTFLMLAVMRGQMRVVRALLEKRVNINEGRLLVDFDGRHTLANTPLLYAISSENISLLDLLLENGADPLFVDGKYTDICRYVSNIPFISALGKGGYIFNRILQYSNVFTTFGPRQYVHSEKHTCLCYAIRHHLCESSSRDSFQCVEKIIEKGGMVCSGYPHYTSRDEFFPCTWLHTSEGSCNEIAKCLTEENFHDASAVYECLSLVCSTDYVHEHSTLYKTLATYTDGITKCNSRAARHKLAELPYSYLTWMANISKQPSTLKHICRVCIRRSIPELSIDAVKRLPLPIELIDYVNVVNKV